MRRIALLAVTLVAVSACGSPTATIPPGSSQYVPDQVLCQDVATYPQPYEPGTTIYPHATLADIAREDYPGATPALVALVRTWEIDVADQVSGPIAALQLGANATSTPGDPVQDLAAVASWCSSHGTGSTT